MLLSLISSQIVVLTVVINSVFGIIDDAESRSVSLQAAPQCETLLLNYNQTQYRCIQGQWQMVDVSAEMPLV